MRSSLIFIAIHVVLIVTGFTSTSNGQEYRKYGSAAHAAVQAGDWRTAREYWVKALASAESAGVPAQQLAILNYEYGRSLGVQCLWGESEKFLLKAFELDHQTGGQEYMSLVELSRLTYDHKQFDRAIAYFERAVTSLEKKDLAATAPVEFAIILEEYAIALTNKGRAVEAADVRKRSQKLRADHPKILSVTERTPYGTQCVKEK